MAQLFHKDYFKKQGRLDIIKDINARYYATHRDIRLLKAKDYYEENKIMIKEKRRARYQKMKQKQPQSV